MKATATVPPNSTQKSPNSAQPHCMFLRANSAFRASGAGKVLSSGVVSESVSAMSVLGDRVEGHRDEEEREVEQRVVEEVRGRAALEGAPELQGVPGEERAEQAGSDAVE